MDEGVLKNEKIDVMTPDKPESIDVVAAICAAISTLETSGDVPLQLEAEPAPPEAFDIPLATASGHAALSIRRLDGKDLVPTQDGLELVDRLQRAEQVITALEALLGLEFAPAAHDMTDMAAMLRVAARGPAGDVQHVLALGLDGKLLKALPRKENIPPVLAQNLPVHVNINIHLPPAASDVNPGDIVLLGGSGPSTATVAAPEPVGTFGAELQIGGCTIARAADASATGPQYRATGVRLPLHALQSAKQGAPLTLPADMPGQFTIPDGRRHGAQLVAIGDAIGIRINSSNAKAA